MARAKKKKKKRLAHILFAEIVVLLLLIGAVNVYSALNKIQHNSSEDENIEQNEIEEKEGFRNIAIFGVDSRENALIKGTHTDTIIVASINNKTKDVKLTSIYRDTYVNIPEKGYDKINAAYFKGGYSLALSTINTNFDLDVKEYVTVNFKAVVNTIDRLGGITLDISKEELKWLNGYVRELNRINGTNVPGLTSAGTQTVNGTQATAYARIRYTAGGDYKRTERQRIVISKIFEKVKKSDLATINSLIDDIFPQISTNLTSLELLGLAKDVFSYNIVDQTGFPFEKDAHNYKRVSYVFPINLQDNVTKLHEFLFDETGYQPSQTVQEYSNYIENIRVQ
ncbi:MAG: LytR family transcriptional regulator [Lachnospiraceae bacterium]|jgi:LCP family protein required for cell wall assembly|nr:LytR family transcriptional regulator [Lachnospiraceae bacterium]